MRLLIVDDDAGLRQSLGLLLTESGYEVAAEGDPEEGLARALDEKFDLVLCDVRMPKMDGLTFLRRYRAERGPALMVMMSAYGGEDVAIAAMREGAYDYLHKPFRPDEVTLTLRKAEERERLRREVEQLRATLGADAVRDILVAESPALRSLLELAERVAAHDTTVLLTGESGTGKEVMARAIHRMSPRSAGPFTAINCAAIPEHLLESELFGHVRGAFTGAVSDRSGIFESTNGGTLMLDEIGDLPLGLQAKLLRVLEEGEIRRLGGRDNRAVDVRVIAATAKDLERAVESGQFRDDLYYRINVVRLHVPPLRERPADVPALVAHFAQAAAEKLGRAVSLTPRALAALAAHPWPGNVRELRNAIERAAVLSSTGRLDVEDFPLAVAGVEQWPLGQRRLHAAVGRVRAQAADRAARARHDRARAGGVEGQPAGSRPPPGREPPHPLLQAAPLPARIARVRANCIRRRRCAPPRWRPAPAPSPWWVLPILTEHRCHPARLHPHRHPHRHRAARGGAAWPGRRARLGRAAPCARTAWPRAPRRRAATCWRASRGATPSAPRHGCPRLSRGQGRLDPDASPSLRRVTALIERPGPAAVESLATVVHCP